MKIGKSPAHHQNACREPDLRGFKNLAGPCTDIYEETEIMRQTGDWAVEPLVPDEVYTDREEFTELFHNAALNAIRRRTMSAALLGHRRMGKTEIFRRVVNRLFFEQDHRDPDAVVPVFYELPDEITDRRDFALKYAENFLRWYAAFRLRNPGILSKPRKTHNLLSLVEERLEMSEGLSVAIDFVRAVMEEGAVPIPEQDAVKLPREVAAIDDRTVVVFLDEFQNTRLPNSGFSVTGFFKQAVESPRCPHFVTGSAMSILADDILGRGGLYGRFDYERIGPFTDYWGRELSLRAARHYGADLPELMAPVVSDRCGGNPFYISAVIRQAAKRKKRISDEETLSRMLAVDISSGFIWGELGDQVSRWIGRVNEQGITKWILYLAALEEDGKDIDLERIQNELKRQENADVPLQKIREILIRLARGDLLEYKAFGNWFGKISDPILNEFLKVWGRIEIERQNHQQVEEKVVSRFEKTKRRFHEYKGYLAEVYMIQILWNSQGRTLPGRYFHSDRDIVMPDRFFYIDQRHRPGAGERMETDIYAGAGTEVWMAESKWRNRPAGPDVVTNLLRQAEILRERKGDDLRTLRLWIFSHDGLTGKVLELVREHGILWSSRAELDGLLREVNLRKLPELEETSTG